MRKCFSKIQFFSEAVLGDLHSNFLPILIIGATGALLGLGYLWLLRCLSNFLGPEHTGPWVHLLILAGTGLAVGWIKRYWENPGEMELLVDNIHVLGGHDDFCGSIRSLVPMSLLCIAAGGAAGPEAPLVQTSGTFGTWLARRRRASVVNMRVLTITGMAAGFTVLFGAPLGAAIFALEILHRKGLEYYEALLPSVLGSLCGYAVYVMATGLGLTPVWEFPTAGALRNIDLVWALAAGVVGAVIAGCFTYLTTGLRWLFSHIPVMPRAVVGGIVLGLLALLSPFALTFGEAQVNTILASQAIGATLLIAALAKMCGTAVTVSTGWRGGFIIPLLFIGTALGRWWHAAMPSSNEVVLMAALMVAINTGVTKTPLGSTLVVTKMAGLPLLPTTLLAAVVALLLTSEVGLIHSQQRRSELTGETPPLHPTLPSSNKT